MFGFVAMTNNCSTLAYFADVQKSGTLFAGRCPKLLSDTLHEHIVEIFSLLTDTWHTSGLALHSQILAYMFALVHTEKITVVLENRCNNKICVHNRVASQLKSAFRHLSDDQIKEFRVRLFKSNTDVPAFTTHLRDFLIEIRVCIYINYLDN